MAYPISNYLYIELYGIINIPIKNKLIPYNIPIRYLYGSGLYEEFKISDFSIFISIIL